jgi:hypothetical protein
MPGKTAAPSWGLLAACYLFPIGWRIVGIFKLLNTEEKDRASIGFGIMDMILLTFSSRNWISGKILIFRKIAMDVYDQDQEQNI